MKGNKNEIVYGESPPKWDLDHGTDFDVGPERQTKSPAVYLSS